MCGVWYNIDGDVASCWLPHIADQLYWCSTFFQYLHSWQNVCHLYICHPSHQICMSIDLHLASSCQHVPSHLCMIHCNFMIWLGVCWEVDCAGCDHACFNSNSHALLVTTTNLLSSIIHTHFMYHDWFEPLWCGHFYTHVHPQHCSQDDNTKTYPNHSSISSPFLQTWTFMRHQSEKPAFVDFCTESTTFKNKVVQVTLEPPDTKSGILKIGLVGS